MANNQWGDFQTPPQLAEAVLASLGACRWDRLLEPTCGVGRFLRAATGYGPELEQLGLEVQSQYVREALASGHRVLERNIFDLDLGDDLPWTTSGPLLVIGNPPWVTSSQLGALGSINLPAKSNIRNLSGFDAMTGSSNFDIAEFIFLKLMLELQDEAPTIALLVKTQVARNVLTYASQFSLPYSDYTMRLIDAKAWFGASVDACLFTVRHSERPSYICEVYDSLESQRPSRSIGIVRGLLVADVDKYEHSSFADGSSPVEWRSGVKHDAAKVMELTCAAVDELGLEGDYVYPLLKCTDLFRDRLEPARRMVIPQHRFGEDTAHLESDAPMLWQYLESNAEILDSRRSSIYRKQPRFAVFGLGEYTFAPYKIAISGFHKVPRFVLLGPYAGRPIVVDDASYTLSFLDALEASLCHSILTNKVTTDLIEALVFWDSKRPINKKLLQRIDLLAIAERCDPRDLASDAGAAAMTLGVDAPLDWMPVLDRLRSTWRQAS